MRVLVCFLLGFLVCSMSAPGEPPEAGIPRLSKTVTLDGVLAAEEWIDAAVVRNIRTFGNAGPAEPHTTFYLKFDERALWIAARCEENDHRYPVAHHREVTDLLSNDDSIQIVLGVWDPVWIDPEEPTRGDDTNAFARTWRKPDQYYQYTVNAVGARSRFFNETPLDRLLFEAHTVTAKNEWTVEMRIPFNSFGLDDPAGLTMPANFFRFRPPTMTAWHLPGFGNYAPMPFGAVTFLSADRTVDRTVEAEPAGEGTAPARDAEPGTASATVEYYPYTGSLVGNAFAPGGVAEATATLRISGEAERQVPLGADGHARIFVDLPRPLQEPVRAEWVVQDGDGSVLASATQSFESAEMPAWHRTQAGIAYVDQRVPRPWRTPQIEYRIVRLHDKQLTFAESGLLASVVDDNGELLAGEAGIVLRVDGEKLEPVSAETVVRLQGSAGVVDSTIRFPGGSIETRTKVEFDGFTIVKMRLRGFDPRTVSRLAVEYPLRKDDARFLHFTTIQDVQELRGFGWTGHARPVWLGGHEKGLSFSFDGVSPFLSQDRRRQIEVVEDEHETVLRANFIDAPGQLESIDTVLRFFVMPTPTKRPSIRKDGLAGQNEGDKVFLHRHELWSDYNSYPDLAKIPELRSIGDQVKTEGSSMVQLYFGYALAENSPGFAPFASEFKVVPEQIAYRRAYDPGRGVPCWLVCIGGPYSDLLLHGISELNEKAGVRGLFFDGTTLSWDCDNPAHKSCGRLTSIGWDTDEVSRVIAIRNFLKRIHGIYEETGEGRSMILVHNGGALDPPIMSLAHVFYEGENSFRYPRGYRFPLHKFAVGYSGRAFGHRTDMIPELWFYDTSKLLPWSLLHDTMVNTRCAPLEWRIFKDFQDEATTRYYPYWRPQPHIAKLGGDVLCSYYRRDDQTLLVVSNLGWRETIAELDASGLYPESQWQAVDEISRSSVPVEDGKLTFGLGAHACKAIRVVPDRAEINVEPPSRQVQSEEGSDLRGYDPSMWEFSQGSNVSIVDPDEGGDPRGFKLDPDAGGHSAKATLRRTLGAEGSIRLKVQRTGPGDGFEVRFAGAYLPLWTRAPLEVEPRNNGRLYAASLVDKASVSAFEQPSKVDFTKRNTLVLSWADGRLDSMYGGEPLAEDFMLKDLGTGGPLTLSIYPGFSVAVEVIKISMTPEKLARKGVMHPVLDPP